MVALRNLVSQKDLPLEILFPHCHTFIKACMINFKTLKFPGDFENVLNFVESAVLRGQTSIFSAGRYRLQYKCGRLYCKR